MPQARYANATVEDMAALRFALCRLQRETEALTGEPTLATLLALAGARLDGIEALVKLAKYRQNGPGVAKTRPVSDPRDVPHTSALRRR